MLRHGIDILEIGRIKKALSKKHRARFLNKIYTAKELELYENNIPELAARWSAKEAVSKMLGYGLLPPSPLKWREIEILPDEKGKPVLYLSGKTLGIAAMVIGVKNWDISISHTKDTVVASVIAI